MKTHLKEKSLVMLLALAIALPVFAKADDSQGDNEGDNENNTTTYVVTSISPSTFDNNVDTLITITGTGFSTISGLGVRLGKWQDDAKDDTDNIFPLTNANVVNDTTITATVPTGAIAEDRESITVYDSNVTPNTHYTLEHAINVHPSFEIDDEDGDSDGIVEENYSRSNSAKSFFNLTLQGKKIEKKKWIKTTIGKRQGKIVSVTNVGNDTKVRVKLNYGKMSAGQYNIKLNYKDRLRERVQKNHKWKYGNRWERGTETSNNAFVVSGN